MASRSRRGRPRHSSVAVLPDRLRGGRYECNLQTPTPHDAPSPLHLRPVTTDDGPALRRLATSNGLDENSPYAYLMWAEYFGESSIVATTDSSDEPIGFVMGFRRPDEPETTFVWQVGVDDRHRRSGIAAMLLDELVAHTGATHLEATVTPSNEASATLFRRFSDRHRAALTIQELFSAARFPAGHEAEIRYRIGPISAPG